MSKDKDDRFTTSDVADIRGCHPSTVSRTAKRLNIGRRFGRDWLFTEKQVQRLVAEIRDTAGNPDFVRKKRR